MAIELKKLTKGERVEIGLRHVGVGLGWDPNESSSPKPFDLDAIALILGSSGKLLSHKHFVYYNELASPNGAVRSSGDNRDGIGEGDDETIFVDLAALEPEADQIVFAVCIYEAEENRQNFGQIRNSFIRIYDSDTNEEICKYELDEDFSLETSVDFGRLYRRGGQWKFEASGNGFKGGLQELMQRYV